MRLKTVVRRLLGLQAARVLDVELRADAMVVFVDVAPRGVGMTCCRCRRRTTTGAYDSKTRLWRHLDIGAWEVYLRARQRRFHCRRCAAVVTEAMPWAETASVFTRVFEDVVGFFAQETTKTVVSRVMRIAWPTVGNIVRRVVGRHAVPLRARRLVRIGVDEISYRRHHRYVTLVADHDTGEIVWGGEGHSGATLDKFFDALGRRATKRIKFVSLDMSPAFIVKLRERVPHATLAFDPFHVVKLANLAVDEVRRQQMRLLKGLAADRGAIKGSRWILLKRPENLSDDERERLAFMRIANKSLYRAYLLKEALRDVYNAPASRVRTALNAWLKWALRSKLAPFIKLAGTIREHADGIIASVRHSLSNGRLEGLNNKVRLLNHRAFGFHSAAALLALVHLCCGGIKLTLPSDERPHFDPFMQAFADA